MWTVLGRLCYGRGLGRFFLAAWFASFFFIAPPNVYAAAFNSNQALKLSQAAVGRTVTDEVFKDSNGKDVRLSDFRGKPLVVSFIYSSCATACPLITRTLDDVRDVAVKALGEGSFSIVSIGFDVANDSPEGMKLYAISNDVDGKADWHFLSADSATIKRLTSELGFIYRPRSEGFEHLSQITVLDAKGKVYRQIYGDTFKLPLLVGPLRDLVFGTPTPFSSIGNLVKSVRLFCTVYDPSTNSYYFDPSLFIGVVIGIIMIGFIVVYVIRGWLHLYRRGRKTA